MQAMPRSLLKHSQRFLSIMLALLSLAGIVLAKPALAWQFDIQPYLRLVHPDAAKTSRNPREDALKTNPAVVAVAPASTLSDLNNASATNSALAANLPPANLQAPETTRQPAPPAAVRNSVALAQTDELVAEGDQLVISVFGQPDLNADLTVGESGVITLPLVGTLEVKGKSANQIAQIFTQKLEQGQYLRNPKVAVKLVQQQSRSFSVMGEVQRPGRYPLSSALSVLDGLSLAGGMTARADKHVRLLRRAAQQNDAELVEYAAVKLDLDNGSVPEQLAQKLKPNDILFVAQQKNFYIYGEVRKPGMYPMEEDLNIMRVLSIGGGVTERGSARRIVIHRKTADGKLHEIPAQITDKVEAGDVVFVNERIF